MRHGNDHKKLGVSTSHRRAMMRNMATSLVQSGRCETTVVRAKEVRRVVDRLITLAKIDTLHTRRQAYSYLFNKSAVQKLFSEIGPRFKSRKGGYTRVVRTRHRHGDAAEMAVVELLSEAGGAAV